MKVSINIPTYNQDKLITKAVESALNQSYHNIEVNVGDDSTNDLTKIVLSKYCSRPNFNYVKNEVNIGRVKNYHKLLYEVSTGDWALNLDGDDYLIDEHFIEDAVNKIKSNSDLVMICARHKSKTPDGVLTWVKTKYDKTDKDFFIFDGFKEFLPQAFEIRSGHLTSLYNRELAMRIGFYEHDIITADSESVLRLVLHGKVGFINRFVGIWCQHELNASQQSNINEFILAFQRNDLVYDHGLSLNLPSKELSKWKKMMDFRHALRLFGRIVYQNQIEFLDDFIKIVKERKISKLKLFFSPEMIFKTTRLFLKHPGKAKKIVQIFLPI
jgi:glycosyltransferase involved in cell wall biosynthesis|tara:strand:- start:676 stop:1656 length:981 start_codon:yes stop_codon:yes gene_type:complete